MSAIGSLPDEKRLKQMSPFVGEIVNLAIVLALASPAFLGVGGSSIRIVFPLAAFIVATIVLLSGNVARYLTLVLWFFTLTPFVRRIVDFHLGWLDANPLMLAPYMAALPSALSITALLARKAVPAKAAFLAIFIAIAAGLVVALFNGRVAAGAFDAMRWGLPPSVAVLIIRNPQHSPEIRRSVYVFFALSAILVGVYAIVQFTTAPAWDAFWMIKSKMESIGTPEPYAIRAFSTWNSPGSLASYLVVTTIICLTSRSPLQVPALLLAFASLAISLVRSAWLGVALGMVVLALIGSTRLKLTITAIPLVFVVVLPFVLLSPGVGPLLETRLDSLSNVSSDNSFRDRWQGYYDALEAIGDQPFGEGLGAAGSYSSYADGGPIRIIDGGPAQIAVTLGGAFGLLYLLGVAAAAWGAISGHRTWPLDAALVAVVVADVALLSSSATTIGESGMLMWLAIGIRLAAPSPSQPD